jgi:hypothetical protein
MRFMVLNMGQLFKEMKRKMQLKVRNKVIQMKQMKQKMKCIHYKIRHNLRISLSLKHNKAMRKIDNYLN